MLGKVFEKFIAKAPVAVMVRGVLERVLNPDALNDIYARAAVRQYTRDLGCSIWHFSRTFWSHSPVVGDTSLNNRKALILKIKRGMTCPDKNCVSRTGPKPGRLNSLPEKRGSGLAFCLAQKARPGSGAPSSSVFHFSFS